MGGPICGPENLDLCDDEKKASVEKCLAMTASDLEAAIQAKEDAIEKFEANFKNFVQGLNKKYQDASKAKDENIADIKSSGFGMMKSVRAYKKTTKTEEL